VTVIDGMCISNKLPIFCNIIHGFNELDFLEKSEKGMDGSLVLSPVGVSPS